jgi:hypothetical protein
MPGEEQAVHVAESEKVSMSRWWPFAKPREEYRAKGEGELESSVYGLVHVPPT